MITDASNLDFELPSDFADCGSLNWRTLGKLELMLSSMANATTSSTLTVSLANVYRGGASFISVLLQAHHRLRRRNRRLRLQHVHGDVRMVLEVCRLVELFGI